MKYKYDPEIIPTKDEFEEDFEYETCRGCSGSGEGMWDGSTCPICRGTGIERYKKEQNNEC